jgi:periplasmic copper chaperone A
MNLLRRPILKRFFVAPLLSALLLTACQKPAVEGVTDALVKLPVVAGRPGAAYFTLHGGAAANHLMQITSPQIIKIELHESMKQGDMMTMAPIEGGVEVPARGEVKFAPGGKHAMLFDINPKIAAGAKMKLSFTYSSGRVIEVDVDVKAAGDDMEHQQH